MVDNDDAVGHITRELKSLIDVFKNDYYKAKEKLEHDVQKNLKAFVVTLSSISSTERDRQYLSGGGFAPPISTQSSCIFCGHNFVDLPPSMKQTQLKRRLLLWLSVRTLMFFSQMMIGSVNSKTIPKHTVRWRQKSSKCMISSNTKVYLNKE